MYCVLGGLSVQLADEEGELLEGVLGAAGAVLPFLGTQ